MTLRPSWNVKENTIHSELAAADASPTTDGTGIAVRCVPEEELPPMPSKSATVISSLTETRAEDSAEDTTRISSPSGTVPSIQHHHSLNSHSPSKWQLPTARKI